VLPEAWPNMGQVLILWGVLRAGASEAELQVLQQMEDE